MSIPKIKLPGISQADFADAFQTLEECRIDSVPVKGFRYPFFAPGGQYGPDWWNIDSSLALRGYRWKDRTFAENSLRNFFFVQKENGRIPLYSYDHVEPYDEEISSLPKLLEVAYIFAKESDDEEFVNDCYTLIKRYIGWWLNFRRNSETGLVSAVFEETFVPYLHKSGERLAVDTNVEMVVGLSRAAALARRLNDSRAAEQYDALRREFSEAINRFLWNEEEGAYFPYLLGQKRHEKFFMASSFLPLREKIAPKERAERMLSRLTSDDFGWNTYPVFSVSRSDPQFTISEGQYQGNPSWSGSVWTLLNEGIVQGLKDSGYADTAAALAYRTVQEFNGKYFEFLQPLNGSGQGVVRYAWTASQYIQLILESIFGISIDAAAGTVCVRPMLCTELQKGELYAREVPLPDGGTISVSIQNGAASVQTAGTGYKIQ